MTNPTRWGFSIFCEDIREEVDNKNSWMGVFKGGIYTDDLYPLVIPKLAIIIKYYEVVDVHRENLEFRVYSTDGAMVAEARIERVSLDTHFALSSISENDEALISVQVPFVFVPMVFPKPGVLKVRMFDGSQEMKLGSLPVRSGPAPA